jgi:hypothetical protein
MQVLGLEQSSPDSNIILTLWLPQDFDFEQFQKKILLQISSKVRLEIVQSDRWNSNCDISIN